ncbi:MAG: putative zinc-binding protein [Candidatus Aminicenantales bacterium]
MSNRCCSSASTLIFACSGASDVGGIADLAARKLTGEGLGNMFCLAGVGGRVSGIMKSTESAERILAIDGCPLDCTKKCLEEAGYKNYLHLQLAHLGMKKGKSPADDKNVEKAAARCRQILT